jgi:hypothetical protein
MNKTTNPTGAEAPVVPPQVIFPANKKMVLEKILPLLPLVPIAGLVFQAGRQSEKLDELFTKSFALESEQKGTRDILFDIHGKVCTVEQEVRTISARMK